MEADNYNEFIIGYPTYMNRSTCRTDLKRNGYSNIRILVRLL